jgi:oligoribonuclease (3'-5' exoribonuclease)
MTKYLHIDCEMGGRDLKYSLLQIYFMVTDDKFNIEGELYLNVKPDDGDYIVSGQGMGVNKINLQNHDAGAISYKIAKPMVYEFLKTHANGGKLIPVGHGVKGDVAHIQQSLISEGSWENFCSYHYIDTSVVLQFLRACGKMPSDCDGSVGALAKHFKLDGTLYYNDDGEIMQFHDAKYDTRITAKILERFVELGMKG